MINEIRIPLQAINLGAFRRATSIKRGGWKFITQKIDDADFEKLKYDRNIFLGVPLGTLDSGTLDDYLASKVCDFGDSYAVSVHIHYAYKRVKGKVYVSSESLCIEYIFRYRIEEVHRDSGGFFIGTTLLGHRYHRNITMILPSSIHIYLASGRNLYWMCPRKWIRDCQVRINALRGYNGVNGIFGGGQLVKQAKKVFDSKLEVVYKDNTNKNVNGLYWHVMKSSPLNIWNVYLSEKERKTCYV